MYGSPMYASAITRMRTIVSAAEPTGRRRLSPIWSIRDAAVIKRCSGGLLRRSKAVWYRSASQRMIPQRLQHDAQGPGAGDGTLVKRDSTRASAASGRKLTKVLHYGVLQPADSRGAPRQRDALATPACADSCSESPPLE